MSTTRQKGGASAPPNVLAFPAMNESRRKRRNRADARSCMGEWALGEWEDSGRAIPPNVQRLVEPQIPEVKRSPELALIVTIFSSLPEGQREKVRESVRVVARHGGDPNFRAALRLITPVAGEA